MKITHALAIIFVPVSLYMWHFPIDVHLFTYIQLGEGPGCNSHYSDHSICDRIYPYTDRESLLFDCIDH